jgi:ABC-type spermidine/putrescine transport system permease subunit II
VLLTLFGASMVAYVLSRMSFWFNIPLLILFTAGNLLPQQVIITPLYRIYLAIHLPDWISGNGLLYNSYAGLIVINVAFQIGFCVFVLSNYMKTVPTEIDEAAVIDGATLWTRYWRITLPLVRPALAALATLLNTWIYNDFFWAITLISTGNKRPITSALANLQGQFVANQNMIAAAALIAAIPPAGVRPAAEAVHRRPVPGLLQGLTPPAKPSPRPLHTSAILELWLPLRRLPPGLRQPQLQDRGGGGLSGGEAEALGVHLAGRHLEGSQAAKDGRGHRRRPADEGVALGDVRNQLGQ